MAMILEDAFISVWRQILVENAKTMTLNDESYPIRRTSRSNIARGGL
jgi:hypothetical protein